MNARQASGAAWFSLFFAAVLPATVEAQEKTPEQKLAEKIEIREDQPYAGTTNRFKMLLGVPAEISTEPIPPTPAPQK